MKLKTFLNSADRTSAARKNIPMGLGVFISHAPNARQVTQVTPCQLASNVD
jgi:hypothetical protein